MALGAWRLGRQAPWSTPAHSVPANREMQIPALESLPGASGPRLLGEGLPLPTQGLRQVWSGRKDPPAQEGTSITSSMCCPGSPEVGARLQGAWWAGGAPAGEREG